MLLTTHLTITICSTLLLAVTSTVDSDVNCVVNSFSISTPIYNVIFVISIFHIVGRNIFYIIYHVNNNKYFIFSLDIKNSRYAISCPLAKFQVLISFSINSNRICKYLNA